MSETLINPPWYRKAFTWLRTASPARKALFVTVGLALLLVAVLLGIDRCKKARFESGMKKANANLVNALDKLSNIQDQQAVKEKELQQIEIEEAVQKQVVIQAAKDAEIAANIERDAKLVANQAAENANAINAKDFSNTSLENAQRARCQAFPHIPECKQ